MENVDSVGIYSKTVHNGNLITHRIRYFKAEGIREVRALVGWDEFLVTHRLYGAKEADNDADDLTDWGEYVMGGDPNDYAHSGIQPSLDTSTGNFIFSLMGDNSISAHVLTNSVLMDSEWGTNGTVDVMATDGELGSYTNAVDMTFTNLFIKLIVE